MNYNNSNCVSKPLVSVGMPLFNNALTIEKAVNSIRRQTWKNIEIILSDDGSLDETLQICSRLATLDPRLKLFKQSHNLYYQNFCFVLEKAKGNFFLWAAGDDYLRPSFIEANMQILLSHDDTVGCVSRCLFINRNTQSKELAKGTYSLLDDDPKRNIEAFLRNPKDNTRMYGVYRRDILLSSFPRKNFHAYDWALSATTLIYGKHAQIDSVLMRRDQTSMESYNLSVDRDHQFFLFRYFPVLRMSLHLFLVARVPFSKEIFRAAFKLNYVKHKQYVQVRHPTLYRRLSGLYSWLDRYLLWRV